MAVKMYKAALKSCPFCGNAEQTVCGVEAVFRDGEEWRWNVECDGCHVQTKLYSTEQEALNAWKRRYVKNEVEQDGNITWGFYDLWVECAKRYASECLGERIGADRSDSGSGLDT